MSALIALVLAQAMSVQVAHRKVVTEDGHALALHRYTPLAQKDHLPAVLLIADAGLGRSLYDFEGEGLARYLASTGRLVFVAELRGQGAADDAHSVRTWLALDLPAISKVLPQPIDLVAHGYLGTIALASRALALRRVVAISTPVRPDAPTLLARQFLLDDGRFSTLMASPAGFDQFEQLFAMGQRVDPLKMAAMVSNGSRDLGRGVSRELLAWMEAGDLPLDDGTSISSRLAAYDRPTLMLLGVANAWAPPESCAALRELAPKAAVKLRLFTRFTDGDDFAHLSMLCGPFARRVVYPEVEHFLSVTRE